MRIAIIKNGRVVNIVQAEQEWMDDVVPSQGESLLDISSDTTGISIGWNYDGVLFSSPAAETTYAQLRAAAYPPIAEQLDMQFKDAMNGTTVWADTIAAIKAKYPKV